MRYLLLFILAAAGLSGMACQYTTTLWADAGARSVRAEDVDGILINSSGRPVAIVILYSTGEHLFPMYARIRLNADYSPSAPLRLRGVEGRSQLPVERLNVAQLQKIARGELQLHRRASPSRSLRLLRVTNREFNLRLSCGAEVKVFAYWKDPRAGPELPMEFALAVPAVLERPAHHRAHGIAMGMLLTPVAAAADVAVPVMLVAMTPGFALGIWEWP